MAPLALGTGSTLCTWNMTCQTFLLQVATSRIWHPTVPTSRTQRTLATPARSAQTLTQILSHLGLWMNLTHPAPSYPPGSLGPCTSPPPKPSSFSTSSACRSSSSSNRSSLHGSPRAPLAARRAAPTPSIPTVGRVTLAMASRGGRCQRGHHPQWRGWGEHPQGQQSTWMIQGMSSGGRRLRWLELPRRGLRGIRWGEAA
mmetsp:Transcript_8819/g.21810  ORF Transcript_8819/g.21810 Transcript_8819/m.21810 type:complete len:200 (+) Transcript_8819:159-758(+)